MAPPTLSENAAASTMTDPALLVISCDAYRDLWTPFFTCFFKYWPDCPYRLYLGSNNAVFEDARVSPILVGPDLDYTSNLINMLKQIRQEWVVLWIEDRPPSAPVDTARIARVVHLAQSRQAAYLKLIANYPLALVQDNQEIGEIPKGWRYRVSLTVALWNKAALLALLRPGETPWDIEREGSRRSCYLSGGFYCLPLGTKKAPPIRDQHLVLKGRLMKSAQPFLQREQLLSYFSRRRRQTFGSYLYDKAYFVYLDYYFGALWRWTQLRRAIGA